jgi:hypothetical protein
MIEKLRDRLIGAWKLTSYVEKPVDGGPPNHPMSEHPQGIIMYTPDGYMSAQLMRPNRAPFASSDWYRAKPEEYGREGATYFAYSGPFQVDEENRTVTHHVVVSLFPNWIGQTQIRTVRLEGDMLTLGTASPIQSGGQKVNALLQWERARLAGQIVGPSSQ